MNAPTVFGDHDLTGKQGFVFSAGDYFDPVHLHAVFGEGTFIFVFVEMKRIVGNGRNEATLVQVARFNIVLVEINDTADSCRRHCYCH